jgi:predicted RNA-binding protein with PUA-like domain
MRYWLMKSEPSCFSIDDLKNSPQRTSHWDGVRNYQARNFMRDDMQVGDKVFFYHSNCNPPGIVGVATVVTEAYPDFTAWDPASEHPDPKSTRENPRWFMVDIQLDKIFPNMVTLEAMKHYPQLDKMPLLRKGNRLSVLPVSPEEWRFIETLAL